MLASLWLAMPGHAADQVKPAVTIGGAEVIAVSEPTGHLGFYLSMTLDVGFVVNSDVMLITSSGFEFAPENGHWGMLQFLILDVLLAEVGDVAITLEPQVGFIHDAAPDGDDGFDHALFPSAGVGVAFVTPRIVVIPQLIASVGTKDEGWTIAPTLLYSVGF